MRRGFSIRTAGRASRLLVTLLGVLVTGGLAAHAAARQPDFNLAAGPHWRSVTAGDSTAFGVAITPRNGFGGSVALSVSGLPAGASASFSPGPASTDSTLTVSTGPGTAPGAYALTVAGAAGPHSHARTVTLRVGPRPAPGFAFSLKPASRTVTQGGAATYTVTLRRDPGFTGSVAFQASGLPSGVTATFNPATLAGAATTSTLTLATSAATPAGSSAFTVAGTGGAITHTRSATLVVAANTQFGIAGGPSGPLYPGGQAPLDLALTNPYQFDLSVTRIAVALTGTGAAGCFASGPQTSFAVVQLPAAAYPLRLPARTTTTLSALGVPAAQRPQLVMLNTAFNQDACRGASLSLAYSGLARKAAH
jgi:hypothetical protein